HALPFNEPVVAQGPFVMNTEDEIREAYRDYQRGLFGTWDG
ncbi:MAG: Pirin-related protein, partial [Algoriphagus marincola HL-49]